MLAEMHSARRTRLQRTPYRSKVKSGQGQNFKLQLVNEASRFLRLQREHLAQQTCLTPLYGD
jgi:hypothetical protein